jgi:hypothetical protein
VNPTSYGAALSCVLFVNIHHGVLREISASGGNMIQETTAVPVRLSDGNTVYVEVRDLGGREKVSDLKNLSFENVMVSIEKLGSEITGVLKRLEPQKATVELGFEIVAESGQLSALLVKGSGKANIKVSLEWTK